MKIEYRKGDLFATEIEAIIHGCNAQGVMGSGVAKIVRAKYPYAYEVYKSLHETKGLKMGSIIPVLQPDGKIIVNAITQNMFGRDGSKFVSYDAIRDAMEKINYFAYAQNLTHVAMPQIGAGLGGGEWNIIAEIIEEKLESVKPVVYIL